MEKFSVLGVLRISVVSLIMGNSPLSHRAHGEDLELSWRNRCQASDAILNRPNHRQRSSSEPSTQRARVIVYKQFHLECKNVCIDSAQLVAAIFSTL